MIRWVTAGALGLLVGMTTVEGAVVVEYQFEGNTLDTSGNGENGVLMGDATFGAGRYGQGLLLDGTGDYMHVPIGNYDFSQFTIEMWINTPTFSTNVHYVSLFQNAYLVLGDYGTTRINTWADGLTPIDVGSSVLVNAPSTNAWHHLAFTYDGFNQSLFVDGSLAGSVATSGLVTLNPTSFNLGLTIGARYDASTQFVLGTIDLVRLHDTALAAGDLGFFQDQFTAIPEPPVAALLATGLLALAAGWRRRRSMSVAESVRLSKSRDLS